MAEATMHGTGYAAAPASAHAHAEGQQHPIKLYLVVWGWLFVLSTFSYLVDYFHVQGLLRWSLILLFMVLKAGLIVAIFTTRAEIPSAVSISAASIARPTSTPQATSVTSLPSRRI